MADEATRTSSRGLCAKQALVAKAHTGHRNRTRRSSSLLWFPISSSAYRLRQLSTTATRSPSCFRHWRRSGRSPLSRFFGDFLAGPRKLPAGGNPQCLTKMCRGIATVTLCPRNDGRLFRSLRHFRYRIGKSRTGSGAGRTGAGEQTATEIGGAGWQIWFT